VDYNISYVIRVIVNDVLKFQNLNFRGNKATSEIHFNDTVKFPEVRLFTGSLKFTPDRTLMPWQRKFGKF